MTDNLFCHSILGNHLTILTFRIVENAPSSRARCERSLPGSRPEAALHGCHLPSPRESPREPVKAPEVCLLASDGGTGSVTGGANEGIWLKELEIAGLEAPPVLLESAANWPTFSQ